VEVIRTRLGRGVPDLAALGAREAADLLEPETRLAAWPRAEVLADDGACLRVRYPLPGTPDAAGRVQGRPRGAGTGWVVLEVHRASPWGAALRARFGRPRSASLAERDWNLLCHLRARGVGAPEPVAVGAVGSGLVWSRSFAAAGALDGLLPPGAGVGRAADRGALHGGARALGAALARLFESGVVLPRLALDDVRLSAREACAGAAPPDGARGDVPGDALGGLRLRRLPGVVLAELAGARWRERWSAEEVEALLARWERTAAEWPRADARTRLRVLVTALPAAGPVGRRAERRALVRRVLQATRSSAFAPV